MNQGAPSTLYFYYLYLFLYSCLLMCKYIIQNTDFHRSLIKYSLLVLFILQNILTGAQLRRWTWTYQLHFQSDTSTCSNKTNNKGHIVLDWIFHFLLIESSLLPCLACNQVEIVLPTSSLQWSHVLHLFLDVLQLRTPRSLMESLERSGSIEL